ncbi:TlpA family protein disulfide reductase [Myxococcota bacterium]|nr:TlpA family protein disulfide reductase [Myxococcota bacterium]
MRESPDGAGGPIRSPALPDRDRGRRLSRLSWLWVAVAAALAFWIGGPEPPLLETAESVPAPKLEARVLGEGHLSLEDLRGKVVVVNFWATWCPPCRKEVPELAAFATSHPDVPLLGVAVSSGDDGKVKATARALGINYRVLMGTRAVSDAWRVSSIPVTYVVDPRGRVVQGWQGPVTADDLARAVARVRERG